jgi:alginate O-acetyltransferase complex protein AlgI
VALLVVFRGEPPALRLLASSLLFLYLMKSAVLTVQEVSLSTWIDQLLYLTIWPGMDPERLSQRRAPGDDVARGFSRGLVVTLAGLGSLLLLAVALPMLSTAAAGWIGIASLLTTVHFGFSQVLTALVRLSGRPVGALFDRPLACRSLFDFWTHRWNLAFVEMNRRLFMPAIGRRLGLRLAVPIAFLISGLLHEMALSYPAGGGWGGPLAYFALQYVGVAIERRLKLSSRWWAFAWIALPLPLLFHAPLRARLVLPFLEWLHRLLVSRPPAFYVDALLWSLPAMQLAVLLASYQVPGRLRWRQELPRLSPFNRKLMWTYGSFIVFSILGFAILTLTLHGSFMRGETAAIGLALFMCVFWVFRLVFDAFYFRTEDWPPGVDMQVGHALLNALFLYLSLGYGTVAVWGGALSRRVAVQGLIGRHPLLADAKRTAGTQMREPCAQNGRLGGHREAVRRHDPTVGYSPKVRSQRAYDPKDVWRTARIDLLSPYEH